MRLNAGYYFLHAEDEDQTMTMLIIAKRRNLLGELEDCSIESALYLRKSVYLCPECGKYVLPYSDYTGPRFKHMRRSPDCSYSNSAGRRTKRQPRNR